jgi:FtsP/CotA-like multicopper oxidase with cupredoxin domain
MPSSYPSSSRDCPSRPCPLAPSASSPPFPARRYHGHHLEQYSDGLFGLLQVLPVPGSTEDLAAGLALGAADNEVTLMLSEYFNFNAHELLTLFYISPESEGLEPVPDGIQVNGRHKGQLFMHAPRAGKTLVHVVCASTFTQFRVSIDGVNLRLVEVDSTVVLPVTVPSVDVNVGQRVSFVVDWSTLALPPSARGVFLRVRARTERYDRDVAGYVPPYEAALFQTQPLSLDPNYTAVFQFAPINEDGTGTQLPDYAANGPGVPAAPAIVVPVSGPYAGLDTRTAGRLDANVLDAVPAVQLPVPPGTHQLYCEISFAVDPESEVELAFLNDVYHVRNKKGKSGRGCAIPLNHPDISYPTPHLRRTPSPRATGGMMPSLFSMSVYGTPEGTASAFEPDEFHRSAKKPFGYASAGLPLPPIPIAFSDEAHYLLPPGAVVIMLINNTVAGEHPLYFHGHTVWVLATSERPGGEAARIAAGSAMRRDTVSVPGFGWAKVAFIAENPGIWRVHSHVDWHLNVGFTLNFYEGLSALDGMPVPLAHQENCNLPPPGAASWVLHTGRTPTAGSNASSHERLPVVQAASCVNGEVTRACTFFERVATDFGAATRCPCALSEEAESDGDEDGVHSFDILIDHLFIPEPLVPGAFKLTFGMNGISPGATLEVEQGDWVRVAVTSILEGDCSALQFPGHDLVLTPYAAGVPTISQCGSTFNERASNS